MGICVERVVLYLNMEIGVLFPDTCGDGKIEVGGEGSHFSTGDCVGAGVCCCEDDAIG